MNIKQQGFLFQILKVTLDLHIRMYVHRDLKPGNILIDQIGLIKLCDFGLARQFYLKPTKFTNEVLTLPYRAPEIILGDPTYSTPCDIWSIGCIFFEIVMKKLLIDAESEIGALMKIFEFCGTPVCIPGVTDLPNFNSKFPKFQPSYKQHKYAQNFGNSGLDLLMKMLEINPKKRISAQAALKHAYFDEFDTTNLFDLLDQNQEVMFDSPR